MFNWFKAMISLVFFNKKNRLKNLDLCSAVFELYAP